MDRVRLRAVPRRERGVARDASAERRVAGAGRDASRRAEHGACPVGRGRGKDEEEDEDGGKDGTSRAAPLGVGADPPLAATLAAWPARTLARRADAAGFGSADAYLAAASASDEEAGRRASTAGRAASLARATVARETVIPRIEYVHVTGADVPRALADRLLASLRDARWPASTHRKAVDSERYLVLSRDVSPPPAVDPYDAVKTAARALMRWADPSFPYDHLAVTRGFLGSPHVDREDVTHQYAMALGDFGGGAELVVESEDGRARWVVDTRGKMARFDGRFAHWVRGYDRAEGVRFSVVWYANKPSAATPRTFAPVDPTFRGGDDGDVRGEAGAPRGRGGARGARARRWGMRAVVGLSGLALTVGVVGAARRRGERRRRWTSKRWGERGVKIDGSRGVQIDIARIRGGRERRYQ